MTTVPAESVAGLRRLELICYLAATASRAATLRRVVREVRLRVSDGELKIVFDHDGLGAVLEELSAPAAPPPVPSRARRGGYPSHAEIP